MGDWESQQPGECQDKRASSWQMSWEAGVDEGSFHRSVKGWTAGPKWEKGPGYVWHPHKKAQNREAAEGLEDRLG